MRFSALKLLTIFSAAILFSSLMSRPVYALQGWSCCDNTGIADGNHCDVCGPEMRKSYDDAYGCGSNTNCKKCGAERPRAITCSYGPSATSTPRPTPTVVPLSCIVELGKTNIELYPFSTTRLTAVVTAKSGSNNTAITSAKVNFSLNSAIATVAPASDSSQPYQTIITAGRGTGSANVKVDASVKAGSKDVSCSANTKVTVKKLACSETSAKCTPESEGLVSGKNITCSMTAVKGIVPAGGSVEYQGKCSRKLGSVVKEKFNLTPISTGSPVFKKFQLKTGSYHCEFRYCVKNSGGQGVCMDWEPGTI